MPLELNEIITGRRVVVNEANVQEFVNMKDVDVQKEKKVPKLEKLGTLLSSTPKTSKSSNQHNNQNFVFQHPILATPSYRNPFCNNGFPIWSYTDVNSGCSLFVCSELIQQEECDNLLKNFNAFICDQEYRLKDIQRENIKVSKTLYSEYEYFKYKVPFSYHKIELSYLKLSNLCSYKSVEDYQQETDTFYSKLNSTKWLKHISEIFTLTYKIINSIYYLQRNVYIEEYRDHMDISCILTSLTKICLNPKYRTIIGLENLIQKDWFLAGHFFYTRLNETHMDDKRRGSLEDDKKLSGIAPVFLFFLDCLFQLVIQYPMEFEYNEFYLINLWDYSLTGLSMTFSFNGMREFLDFVNSNASIVDKTFLSKSDQETLVNLFEENNKVWQSHLDRSAQLFVNKHFNKTKSEKKHSILIPCDRIYMLKFWSRCYLRWVERYHAYNSHELDSDVIKPPPLPPKPPKEVDFEQLTDVEIVNLMNNGTKIATTRITEDGHIETSF